MLRSSASLAASMNWNPGSPGWKSPAAPGPAPKGAIHGPNQGAIKGAIKAAIEAEAAFLAGIRAWRDHPWHRDLPDPPERWREGGARLLDYGDPDGGDAGPVVLFVPSLVNRWTVLDLMGEHSMLRWLAARGVHPMLLDWGEPEPAFTLTDHIAGRLVRAMEAAARSDGPKDRRRKGRGAENRDPKNCGSEGRGSKERGSRERGSRDGGVVSAGYCMGGTFATAAAALRPDLVSGLALLAAPWDFHAGDVERLHKLTATCAMLEPLLHDAATVPVDMLQALFALDDPLAVAEKFRQFSRLDPDSAAARLFVALEDWLNDGVPLSGTTARECLRDWYRDNLPGRGAWRVAGLAIDPASIQVPAFVAVPRRDRIVPPESACALARLLPRVTLVEPEAGHVGMTAGRGAMRVLWEPLRKWLGTIDGGSAGSSAAPGN